MGRTAREVVEVINLYNVYVRDIVRIEYVPKDAVSKTRSKAPVSLSFVDLGGNIL